MNVFLDLEETIIHSWSDARLMNAQRIRDFLHQNSVNQVSIFSFAVWDDNDQMKFASEIQPMLETALDVRVVLCPTVQDMMLADTQLTGVHWHGDVGEFIPIRGKHDAFHNWCMLNCVGQSSVLIDDVVKNTFFIDHDSNTVVTTLNVNKL
jgi:hypothetical protein